MFELTYKAGKSFKESYFIAKDADKVKIVSADVLVPEEIQAEVVTSEQTDGVESPIVASPEEAITAITAKCGGDFTAFETLCAEALEIKKAASLKKEAKSVEPAAVTFQTETIKQDKGNIDANGPVITVEPKEVKKDSSGGVTDGSATASTTKQYFGRLPNKGSETPVESINPKSSFEKDRYIKLTAEAAEMKRKAEEVIKENEGLKETNDQLKKDLESTDKNLKEKEKEIGNEKSKKDVDAIVEEARQLAKIDEKIEISIVDKLVKVDEKSLKLVLEVFKALNNAKKGGKEDTELKGLFGGEKKDTKNPFEDLKDLPEMKKASKNMAGDNIPQVFSEYHKETTVNALSDAFNESAYK